MENPFCLACRCESSIDGVQTMEGAPLRVPSSVEKENIFFRKTFSKNIAHKLKP